VLSLYSFKQFISLLYQCLIFIKKWFKIYFHNLTILDPNDEWITYKVTPNKNRPPLIYTEDMLIKERKKAVHDLWVKIKQFNALSFFSISI